LKNGNNNSTVLWINVEKYEGYDFGQSEKTLLPIIPKTIYIETINKYSGQSEMIKSYRLKIYPNEGKRKELNRLISFWSDKVNHFIKLFWVFEELSGSYPPKEHTRGGRLIRDAAVKAWQIVKGAKKTGQKKRPYYNGNEIDLNEFSAYIIPDFQTKEFDLWLNVISLEKRKRLKLPCKKHREFNKALERGELKKSIKISREGKDYYATFFFEFPEIIADNDKVVGIDVGMNHPVVTSDGRRFGDELRNLRIRTKWRKYKGLSAYKQGLNRIAKEIVKAYPGCDFAVERLLFKGKRGRSRRFRRLNNNWAYTHLAHKLEEMGKVEGFRLWKVNPAFSSIECPKCGFTSRANRRCDDVFSCISCGFTEAVDTVGALNIGERVARSNPSLRLIASEDILPHLGVNVGGD